MSDLNDLNKPTPTDLEPDVLDTLRAHVRRAATWAGWGSTANKVAGLMSAVTAAVSGGRSLRLYRRNDANTADEEVVSLPGVSVGGNAATATALQTARLVNGTSFNGSANITTANWGTARTITIGASGKSVNGASSISWTLAEIGAVGVTGAGASGIWGISISGNAATSSSCSGNAATSSSCSGNAASATALQTARLINRTSFNGTQNIEVTEWFHSDRDFPQGTLITTSINYAVSDGPPFILEIRGNSYGFLQPFDLQYQGYIYGGSIINHGGNINGAYISGMVALNVGGNLCFWFPYQAYWQGFSVRVYMALAGQGQNLVTAITNSAKPSGTKEVALSNLYQAINEVSLNLPSRLAGLAAGGVGTYAFAHGVTGSPGTTAAGSSLSTSNRVGSWGPTLTGTWRCMGYADVSDRTTLWLRIS